MIETINMIKLLSQETSCETCTDWYSEEGKVVGDMVDMLDDLEQALEEISEHGDINALIKLK